MVQKVKNEKYSKSKISLQLEGENNSKNKSNERNNHFFKFIDSQNQIS